MLYHFHPFGPFGIFFSWFYSLCPIISGAQPCSASVGGFLSRVTVPCFFVWSISLDSASNMACSRGGTKWCLPPENGRRNANDYCWQQHYIVWGMKPISSVFKLGALCLSAYIWGAAAPNRKRWEESSRAHEPWNHTGDLFAFWPRCQLFDCGRSLSLNSDLTFWGVSELPGFLGGPLSQSQTSEGLWGALWEDVRHRRVCLSSLVLPPCGGEGAGLAGAVAGVDGCRPQQVLLPLTYPCSCLFMGRFGFISPRVCTFPLEKEGLQGVSVSSEASLDDYLDTLHLYDRLS